MERAGSRPDDAPGKHRRHSAIAAVCGALVLAAATASAVTPKDLIELTRAGLSDDVLVALIEADQSGVRLDAAQIIELRNAGVSERVILALLQEQRRQMEAQAAIEPPPVTPPPVDETAVPMPPPEPAPVVVEQQVPVFVPIFVPGTHVPPHVIKQVPVRRSGFGRFINNGWVNGTLPTTASSSRRPTTASRR